MQLIMTNRQRLHSLIENSHARDIVQVILIITMDNISAHTIGIIAKVVQTVLLQSMCLENGCTMVPIMSI